MVTACLATKRSQIFHICTIFTEYYMLDFAFGPSSCVEQVVMYMVYLLQA